MSARVLIGDVRRRLKEMPDESVHMVVTSPRRPDGKFLHGTHWRPRKPYWGREWLLREYVELGRSSSDIGAQFGIGATAIQFWLRKHGIPTRSVSDARKLKRWGAVGESNPMFGRTGALNPNWKGGLTPLRQSFYAHSAWKRIVRILRKRDPVCRLCQANGPLEIHHIISFSEAPLLVFELWNLIRLCSCCHAKMFRQERRWRKKLLAIVQEGGSIQYGSKSVSGRRS